MPRFKGSCGCYNREMAQKFGVITAIIYNDIEDKFDYYEREGELQDGYFYLSQTNRADALAIPRKSYGQGLTRLEQAGLIKKKVGYKPGTTTKATWVLLVQEDEQTAFSLGENDQSRLGENDQSIYNDTKESDSQRESVVVTVVERKWKGERCVDGRKFYTTEEEAEKIESCSKGEYPDFYYWSSRKLVGDETKKRHKSNLPVGMYRLEYESTDSEKDGPRIRHNTEMCY